MIWKPCVLKAKTDGVVDELGNPMPVWADVLITRARLTPFDNSKIGLDKREVTSDQQYFILPVKSIPACEKAVIGDVAYHISQVIILEPRYVVLGCKVYKQ